MSQVSPVSGSKPVHSFNYREVQNENGSRTRVYRAKSTDKSGKPQSRFSADLEGKTKEDTQSLFDSLINDNERDFSQELNKLNSWLDKSPTGSITMSEKPVEAKKPETSSQPSASPASPASPPKSPENAKPSAQQSASPSNNSSAGGSGNNPSKAGNHSQPIPLNDKDLNKAAQQVNKDLK